MIRIRTFVGLLTRLLAIAFVMLTSSQALAAGMVGTHPRSVVAGDFDNDGVVELVYAEPHDDCAKGRVIVQDDAGNEQAWSRSSTGILGTASCND